MSYHIVHILTHASKLSIDRGCLVCTSPDLPQRKIPKTDILAVIIAARGILFTGNCLTDLLKNNCVILHCNEQYRPIGKTIGLHRTVNTDLFKRQIEQNQRFLKKLWRAILAAKIRNQKSVINKYKKENQLQKINENNAEESNAAKIYWKEYFPLFKYPPATREHRNAWQPVNIMLNYGYAVISAILHRSIVAHGLNTTLGIHHRYRFKSDPLLYDLIEPLRPFCDLMLVNFLKEKDEYNLKDWARHVAETLINVRIKQDYGKKIKLLYVVDQYVRNIVNCYILKEVNNIRFPQITAIDEA